ncbi:MULTISPECIES: FAD-binding protein [unclassified Facklamia]|uniref:FAD-binding protein n=1 Tax=Aerococcaceae TaxID=186827 RepID=UPI0013B945F2|nr:MULTISPECIES: FAD-binding protein [unclassified Facklamia]NEW64564.1 FAD-dependent oxidoreductase [Facklamia sp. 252]NEW67889.1 FAD-dependent oxidoreductase [Facklamia sp. 253]QQD65378.1 FAD-dependent oxidoreductase [Aerococcaceae bacterium zg-252]
MKKRLMLSSLVLASVLAANVTTFNYSNVNHALSVVSVKAATYQPGTYTGEAKGHGGVVKVEVTVDEEKIVDIQVVEHHETDGIANGAIEKIPANILESQSLGVEVVSGASQVSNAIIDAVADAVAKAGGDVEALKAVEVIKTGEDEEISTQIVVVGGGASGTAAALRAAELGAKVVVVEMTASPMGQGTMAGGLFGTDSTQQKEQGKTVDPAWYYNQYLTTGNYQVNGALLSRVIKNSGHVVDWLMENGAKLILAHPATGGVYEHLQTMPTSTLHGYVEGGVQAITNLHDALAQKGGEVRYSTKATEIIMDGDKVVGIKAEKEDGGILTIKADRVILATGGFGGNKEKVAETFGEQYGQSRIATNIGTGIEMAKSAGADADYNKAIMMHYGVNRGNTGHGNPLAASLGNAWLHVDSDGNRFMNEEAFVYEPIKAANAMRALPGNFAYEIFDQTMIDVVKEQGYAAFTDTFAGELATNPTKFIEVGREIDTAARYEASHTPYDMTEDIEKHISEGNIIKADSIEELAEKLGATHLVETVARYNELAEKGEDEDHFKDAKYLDKIEGPVYAVKVSAANFLGTLGGVEVNDRLQVLNAQGKAIEGLYAVGSDTSGVYGDSYVYFEGGTLGYAYGSGYLAGENAAREILE